MLFSRTVQICTLQKCPSKFAPFKFAFNSDMNAEYKRELCANMLTRKLQGISTLAYYIQTRYLVTKISKFLSNLSKKYCIFERFSNNANIFH